MLNLVHLFYTLMGSRWSCLFLVIQLVPIQLLIVARIILLLLVDAVLMLLDEFLGRLELDLQG